MSDPQSPTPPAEPEYVIIDGHKVDPHIADRFYDGCTGRRVTDEEWDESQRRIRELEALGDPT
ncbi:MAG TPA: hypothetical protein VIL55_03770 [Naasia sp.]|jgi:hypothetical protein